MRRARVTAPYKHKMRPLKEIHPVRVKRNNGLLRRAKTELERRQVSLAMKYLRFTIRDVDTDLRDKLTEKLPG